MRKKTTNPIITHPPTPTPTPTPAFPPVDNPDDEDAGLEEVAGCVGVDVDVDEDEEEVEVEVETDLEETGS